MKRLQFKKLLNWQILFTILLSLISLVLQHDLINLFYLAILLLAFFLIRFKGRKNWSHIFDIVFLPYIFIHVYSALLQLLIKFFASLSPLWYVLYFMGMLVLLVPITAIDYSSLKKSLWHLFASLWVIINLFLSPLLTVTGDQFVLGLNKSYLLSALIFLEYAYLAITGWGYKFYFNLRIKKGNLGYYLFLLVLIIVAGWMSFFNTFILSATNWGQALWSWDFSLINPLASASIKNIWQLCFSALDAGIMEESARYVFLLTLLAIFAKKKGQAWYAILISSAIFSLLHLLNFSAPGSTVNSLFFQILHAFGLGCLLAVIYLYSGKLWLPMLLHALADFLNTSLTPLGYGGSLLTNETTNLLVLVILTVVPLIFVAIILLNRVSRSYIKKNIQNMLNLDV